MWGLLTKEDKEYIRILKDWVKFWHRENGLPPVRTKRLGKHVFHVVRMLQALESRNRAAWRRVEEVETELNTKRSQYPSQIKLVTKCGCFQLQNSEGIGDEYIVHLVGQDRRFRFQRVTDGLKVYEEV